MTAARRPRTLTDDGLRFVTDRHLATLSSIRPDGSPHVVPVGFTWDAAAGLVRVIASGSSYKARLAGRGGRVAVCQVDGRHWLTFEGVVAVSNDPDRVAEAVRRYGARYRVPRENPARVVLEIVVDRLLGSGSLVQDRPVPTVVAPADPRAPEVAAALAALTAELAGGGYAPDETFGYSADQLEQRGVHLVGAWVDGALAGVGGVEVQDPDHAELKRFWVDPARRGAGVADAVLAALVDHARGRGVTVLRLETGDRQHAAMRFYARHGFEVVPRFPPFEHSATSVCLQRAL